MNETAGIAWGEEPISLTQAREFATAIQASPADQGIVARNLSGFPSNIKVRGMFFDGLQQAVAASRGHSAMHEMCRRAGTPERLISFSHYPHRDFYKLYYLGARQLHPAAPLPEGLRRVARTFFPTFRQSLAGRTVAALMGDKPRTILPLLAKAYNISVEGNEHHAELDGDRALNWRCEVEPVEWYEETFRGIVEGALPTGTAVKVDTVLRQSAGPHTRYKFRITW